MYYMHISHSRYSDTGFSHNLTPQILYCQHECSLHLSQRRIELVIVSTTFQNNCPAYFHLYTDTVSVQIVQNSQGKGVVVSFSIQQRLLQCGSQFQPAQQNQMRRFETQQLYMIQGHVSCQNGQRNYLSACLNF